MAPGIASRRGTRATSPLARTGGGARGEHHARRRPHCRSRWQPYVSRNTETGALVNTCSCFLRFLCLRPAMGGDCELRETQEYGKALFAGRRFSMGESVLLEHPIFSVFLRCLHIFCTSTFARHSDMSMCR